MWCKSRVFLMGSFLLVIFLTQGCNWVDSTGRQGNLNPELTLKDGDIIATKEELMLSLNAAQGASDADGEIESYSWSGIVEEGALQICGNDIELDLAADKLKEVCEDTDNCQILFLENETEAGLFNVMLPKIIAPIGITHQLTVRDNDGGVTELDIHFCIESLNEAPLANDDQYTAVEGSTLVVDGQSESGLLSNDADDNDIRNKALTVIGLVSGSGPAHAQDFTLDPDGSFSYNISPLTPFSVKQDSFSYEVSDGPNTSQATAHIDLSVEDDPPTTIGGIQDQVATIGIGFGPLNISGNFFDPERVPLGFSATGLPEGISVSADGIISGVAVEENNIGEYDVTVLATDGPNSVTLAFIMDLLENNPPEVETPLADQLATAGVQFVFNTGSSFFDPENVPLTFSAVGLPASMAISPSGIINGSPVIDDIGTHEISVIADDGISTAQSSFTLKVQPNQPPVLDRPIPDQLVLAGNPISFNIAIYFSDPENDSLIFTADGLPDSLSMSPAGVISGTSAEIDRTGLAGSNITVTAADPSGNAVSGTFKLTIL